MKFLANNFNSLSSYLRTLIFSKTSTSNESVLKIWRRLSLDKTLAQGVG
jgi:hypothetical protein